MCITLMMVGRRATTIHALASCAKFIVTGTEAVLFTLVNVHLFKCHLKPLVKW